MHILSEDEVCILLVQYSMFYGIVKKEVQVGIRYL